MKNIFSYQQKSKNHHSWKLKSIYGGIVILIVIIFLSSEFFMLPVPISGNSGQEQTNNIHFGMPTPFSGTNSKTPLWAFSGAYANYSFYMKTTIYSGSGFTNYTILKVNTTNESVHLQHTAMMLGHFSSSTVWASWNEMGNTGLYVVNNTQLAKLNEGIVISGNNFTNVKTGIYFRTQMGTFMSDRITSHNSTNGMNGTMYIDENSGLYLRLYMTNSTLGIYANLTATNVQLPSYYITFTESGLPSGKSWSVTFNGINVSATTTSLKFIKGNGTYSFTVGAVTGYKSSLSNGSMSVNGKNTTKTLAFSAVKTSKPTSPLLPGGLSPLEFYGIIGTVVVIAAIGSVIGIMKKKK